MAKPKPKISESIPTDIRVIKKSSCPTLSGKSELIYCLGSDLDDQLFLRLYSASGGGFFNNAWLPVSGILDALENWDSEKPITSVALSGITRGRSVNTAGFLIAALRAEGILEPIDGKQRCHQLGDVEAFLAQAKQLQSGKAPRKATAQKKAPAKAKAAPRTKKTSA